MGHHELVILSAIEGRPLRADEFCGNLEHDVPNTCVASQTMELIRKVPDVLLNP